MRYLVERKNHDFEAVGADFMDVLPSGALEFTKAESQLTTSFVMLYAPGEWVTVCEAAE